MTSYKSKQTTRAFTPKAKYEMINFFLKQSFRFEGVKISCYPVSCLKIKFNFLLNLRSVYILFIRINQQITAGVIVHIACNLNDFNSPTSCCTRAATRLNNINNFYSRSNTFISGSTATLK